MNDAAVETVSEVSSDLTSTKLIIAGVALAATAAGAYYVIRKVRERKSQQTSEPTVVTPEAFVPASK